MYAWADGHTRIRGSVSLPYTLVTVNEEEWGCSESTNIRTQRNSSSSCQTARPERRLSLRQQHDKQQRGHHAAADNDQLTNNQQPAITSRHTATIHSTTCISAGHTHSRYRSTFTTHHHPTQQHTPHSHSTSCPTIHHDRLHSAPSSSVQPLRPPCDLPQTADPCPFQPYTIV